MTARQLDHIDIPSVARRTSAHERVVDEGIDPSVLHQPPRVLRRGDVRLSIKRDLDVRVFVEPLDEAGDARDAAHGAARDDLPHHVALRGLLLLDHLEDEANELEDGDDEGSEGDRAERERRAPDEGFQGGALGKAHVAHARAVVVPSWGEYGA